MAEIVGKDFIFSHLSNLAQVFHFTPYVAAVDGVALLGYEYGALADVLLLYIT